MISFQNLVAKTLDMLTRMSNSIKGKNSDLSAGQAMILDQLASRFLSPAIEMLQVTQPYLDEATPTGGDFDIIPDELLILVNGLLKKAEDGSASAPEMLLAGFFKDVKGFFESDGLESNKEVNETREFTRDQVEKAVGSILTALPALQDLNNLSKSGS